MKTRGFSLMEMMVAMAISSIIAAAALTAFVSIAGATRRVEQQARADEEAKLLVDFVMTRVQQAGGGQLRPWMVLEVDDNASTVCNTTLAIGGVTLPACNDANTGSDRLHVVVGASGDQCTIATVAPNAAAPTSVTSPVAGCCITSDFANESVLLVGADGTANAGRWRTDRCSSVDTTACTCTLAGQSAYKTPGLTTTALDGGVIAVATTHSFFLDRATGMLQYVSDEDNDGIAEVSELADHVEDFQIELGFDTNGDQIVDVFQSGYTGQARTDLRAIRVGIIVAAPVGARTTSSASRIFNGPPRSRPEGFYLRSVSTKATLRNLNIFF